MSYPKDLLFSSTADVDADLCLVLMPLAEEWDPVYECVRRAVESSEVNMRCIRADEMYSTKSVMADVLDLIRRANVVIAEVTSCNPNVLYELGICHAVKDKVVLLTQQPDTLPFDFKHIRTVSYQNSINGGFALVDHLKGLLGRLRVEPAKELLPSARTSAPEGSPLEILQGRERCLRALVESLRNMQEQHGDASALVRALPIEFTAAAFGPTEKPEVKSLLAEYERIVKHVVLEGLAGVENWDYTVYGRTASTRLNEATWEFIKGIYFGGTHVPETSEIGVDVSWNHVGFIVLGGTKAGIEEFNPDVTFLFYGEEATQLPISGCIVRDESFSRLVVRRWYASLREKCMSAGLYWNLLNYAGDEEHLGNIMQVVEDAITGKKRSAEQRKC